MGFFEWREGDTDGTDTQQVGAADAKVQVPRASADLLSSPGGSMSRGSNCQTPFSLMNFQKHKGWKILGLVALALLVLPVWPPKLPPGVWPEAEFLARKPEFERLAEGLTRDFDAALVRGREKGEAPQVLETYTQQMWMRFGRATGRRSILLGSLFEFQAWGDHVFHSKLRPGLPHLRYYEWEATKPYVTPENFQTVQELAESMKKGFQSVPVAATSARADD